MSDESIRQEPMVPFLYAVLYPSGEVFAIHKNQRVAEGIANMEREWNPCEVITLYAKTNIPDSVVKPEGEEMSVKPTYEELERYGRQADITIENLEMKLAESQREFRAADATIENLETKYEALAAELSTVEAIHNEAVFITDEQYEQCPPKVQKIIRSLAVLQIPAYLTFLAEVRAQGVEMVIAAKKHQKGIMHTDTFGYGAAQESLRNLINELELFAAQLRQQDAQ